jgi:HEPN domain-containing protein
LQKLAAERVADAKALLKAGRWAGVYYLAGYAVECALKACILARLAAQAEILFEDRKFSEKCWTHDLNQLVDLAGLKAALAVDCVADPELADNWVTVKEWSETSRYERKAKGDAQALYDAITNNKHGVFKWIKARW